MTVSPTSVHVGRQQHRSSWVLVAILAFVLGGLAVGLLYHYDVIEGSSNSTIEGNSAPATQARDVAAFNSVELAGSNNVVIRVGEKHSVVVKADRNLLNRVTTEVHSRKLVIANTPGSFTTKTPMTVEVTVPRLNALTLSGSGNIIVGGIEAGTLKVALPGAGMLTASGTATQLDVIVSGAGTVQFTRLVANHVRAVVSGSGSIFTTATNSLDASISGSGAILYVGNPQDVTKSVTGTGAITGS